MVPCSRATATATIVRRFGTLAVEAAPDAVQALLARPGDRDDVGGLAVLAALERLAAGERLAVVPGRLDQQPPRVA
jgi:hypothetical protein